MRNSWFGVLIFGICVVAAPFLARVLWRRGISQRAGYVAGFVLVLLGALVAKSLGSFAHAFK